MRCPIVACILAGGEGTRLLPLTIDRTKPAVRFYRGTADAVYQNLALLKCIDPAHVLILGGDMSITWIIVTCYDSTRRAVRM